MQKVSYMRALEVLKQMERSQVSTADERSALQAQINAGIPGSPDKSIEVPDWVMKTPSASAIQNAARPQTGYDSAAARTTRQPQLTRTEMADFHGHLNKMRAVKFDRSQVVFYSRGMSQAVDADRTTWEKLGTNLVELEQLKKRATVSDLKKSIADLRSYELGQLTPRMVGPMISDAVKRKEVTWEEIGITPLELEQLVLVASCKEDVSGLRDAHRHSGTFMGEGAPEEAVGRLNAAVRSKQTTWKELRTSADEVKSLANAAVVRKFKGNIDSLSRDLKPLGASLVLKKVNELVEGIDSGRVSWAALGLTPIEGKRLIRQATIFGLKAHWNDYPDSRRVFGDRAAGMLVRQVSSAIAANQVTLAEIGIEAGEFDRLKELAARSNLKP